jgi:hypothetical protein
MSENEHPSQENDHFFTPGSAQVSQDAPANAPKLVILGVTLANISSSGTNLAAFWLHLGCRFVDRVLPRRPGAAWTSKTIPQIHILKIFGTDFGSFLENVIECFLYRSFCCVRASFVSLCCWIFLYYVLSVLCERSAQASEASVARQAIQTHAHSQRLSSCLCFSLSVCPFSYFSCFFCLCVIMRMSCESFGCTRCSISPLDTDF